MSGNIFPAVNKTVLENTVFDSGKLLNDRNATTPIREFITAAFGTRRASLILAKAVVCVPVGQTAFFQSRTKSFIFVVNRATDSNFLITIRNKDSGLSFASELDSLGGRSYLAVKDVQAFLGSAADISKMIHRTWLSICVLEDQLSGKLKTPDKNAPFLGIAGHKKSPERTHLNARLANGSIAWIARPA